VGQPLPDTLRGVVLGNEVLDAMPVQLLARVDGVWHERGVIFKPNEAQPAPEKRRQL
jgi:SAM-dependent MidA family methyltransferase